MLSVTVRMPGFTVRPSDDLFVDGEKSAEIDDASKGCRSRPLFTLFSADIPDVKRFAQINVYQCSYRRANAYVGGPNLLTWEGIYP
jgi:hypothetical protein